MGIPLRVYIYRGEAGGSPEDVGTISRSLKDICIFCRSCIQMGGGVGGMLTFIALRHQKMLLRWRSFLHTDGGVRGDVNVHCIASSEFVVTLKMLLHSRCCYECFQNGFVDVKRKKAHVHFANGSLVDYDMFMSIKRNMKFQETRNSYRKSKNDKGWWNWKRQKQKNHWNSGQHIPDMLSACWTNSWYSHVIGRTQNTVKHGEKLHFSNWNTMNFNCILGNPSLCHIYINTLHHHLSIWYS